MISNILKLKSLLLCGAVVWGTSCEGKELPQRRPSPMEAAVEAARQEQHARNAQVADALNQIRGLQIVIGQMQAQNGGGDQKEEQ